MKEESTKGRLLVVDDDYSICKLLTERLSRDGYECQSCEGAKEAFRLMEQQVFDLVILDLVMPGMTGMEFLFLAHEQYPCTAFLIATGVHNASVEATARKLGTVDYLEKPFDYDVVARRVKRALDVPRSAAPRAKR